MKLLKLCQTIVSYFVISQLLFSSQAMAVTAKNARKPKAIKASTASRKISKRRAYKPQFTLHPTGTLSEQIDYILDETGLTQCEAGLKVVDLNSGKILYEKNADRPMNPASNIKIITAAAALQELGPEYIFKTEFFSENPIDAQGRLHNLWIKGYGDPVFVTEEMDAVVDALENAGLKEITGNIYLDDSYFGGDHNINYSASGKGRNYTIVLGALSYNFNRGQIKVAQNSEEEIDQNDLKFRKKTYTKHRRSRQRPIVKKRTISAAKDPSLAFGMVFAQKLEEDGINVAGKVEHSHTPDESSKILVHNSPNLRDVIKGMGKFSNNFIAEQLLRVLGGEKLGAPASTQKGLETSRHYLQSLGIPQSEFSLDNGSGLSLNNRLSPTHFIDILEAVYHSPYRNDFIDSLSIAGIDGTLKRRMRVPELEGKVFAKTGTLNKVSALSGYLFSDKKKIVFSILLNDVTITHEKLLMAKQEILRSISNSL